MITEQKLKIYKKYKGDIDHFARSGRVKERSIFNDRDWHQILELHQGFLLISKGKASKEFENNYQDLLKNYINDVEVISKIEKYFNRL